MGVLGANLIKLIPKKTLVILILFATIGIGGVVAASSISINSALPVSLGAGYAAATSCDESVTLNAKTALDPSSGQLYVATIALSDINQNVITGCGNKTMELALKINGQMTYASWDIPAAYTDSTFNFTGATSSLSDYNAMSALTPFQADGLTNIAIAKIGSFDFTFNWTERQPDIGTARNWSGVTSSADGVKLAAIIYGRYLYTSTDSGVTWTERSPVTASTTRNWRSITSSADGTKLAASVENGYIYTSTDSGLTWTERSPVTASTTRNWIAIASSTDGTNLAAAVLAGYIYTSTDSGATWTTNSNSSGIQEWRSITSSADGTKLAAIATGGYIYTSSDAGSTWTTNSNSSSQQNWYSITSSADGTKLAAAAFNGLIFTSSNAGITWTTNSNSSGSRGWHSITSSADGIKLAAVVAQGGNIYTSSDAGVKWTQSDYSPHWYSITSSADGMKLAVGVYGGHIHTGSATKTRSN